MRNQLRDDRPEDEVEDEDEDGDEGGRWLAHDMATVSVSLAVS